MENWERSWVDYYDLLGLLPTADKEVVLAVYRRLVRKYGVPGGTEPDESVFRILNDAKWILTDADRRSRYDAAHEDRPGRPPNPGTTPPGQEASPDPGSGQTHDNGSDAPPSDGARDERPTAGAERAPSAKTPAPDDTRPNAQEPTKADAHRGRPADQWTHLVPVAKFSVEVDRSASIESLLEGSECQVDSGYRRLLLRYRGNATALTHETKAISLVGIRSPRETPNDLLADLNDLGYRPIDLVELLCLAGQHLRSLRRYKWILALEDPWTIPFENGDSAEWDYQYRNTPLYATLVHGDDSMRRLWVHRLIDLRTFEDGLYDRVSRSLIAVTEI